MKTRKFLFVAIAIALLTTSSRCINVGSGITPSKNYITRDFKVGDFNKLDLATVANVYYTQSTDSKTSLQVCGPDNIVELVNVDIKDNTLVLSMKKKNIKKANLTINISSPGLQQIKTHGVGNFNVKGQIEVTNLTILNEGVGNMNIDDISCRELNLHTKGVGDVHIRGKAEKASLTSTGVGNIDAADLESRIVTASSNGVGNISCHATQAINARTNGVGNIQYKGNPADKQFSKNGIGSIKQK